MDIIRRKLFVAFLFSTDTTRNTGSSESGGSFATGANKSGLARWTLRGVTSFHRVVRNDKNWRSYSGFMSIDKLITWIVAAATRHDGETFSNADYYYNYNDKNYYQYDYFI